MKRTRPPSTDTGSSKKKTWREHVTEVPSQGTSLLAIDPELVHADSEGDEGPEVPLLPRIRRTKGHTVIMIEISQGEVTERQTTDSNSLLAPVPVKAVSSSAFQHQKMIIDLPNIQPSSSVEVLEQSPIIGLVEGELPTT